MAEGGGMDELADILPQVSNTPLDEEDLFDIQEALISAVAKWKSIGTGLGIKRGRLDEIEAAHSGDPSECMAEMLTTWLRRSYNVKRFGKPTWKKLTQTVSKSAAGNNPALALTIANKHLTTSDSTSSQSNSQEVHLPDGGPSFMKPLASRLRQQLELLNSVNMLNQQIEESKITMIKEHVKHFVGTSLRAGASADDVKKVLSTMYGTDVLVSGEVYEWALGEVSVTAQAICLPQSSSPSDKEEKLPPLFCKETLYHASLCCYAVCTCDANTYKDFFSKDFPSHNLEEVSLSLSRDREQVNRYLIARHGKTYYVAFQSEPLLAQWLKFTSFQEGIKVQSRRIPLRFFVQQMQRGYRIVFTGFSFGGLLALSLAALLWKLPYFEFSTDLLKENFVCITFGQPIISLPTVQEVAEECPEFESVVHSILTKADVVPQLMKFLDQKYEEQCAQILLTSEIHAGVIAKSQKSFQGSFSSLVLCYLSSLQKAILSKGNGNISTDDEALRKVKAILMEVVPHLLAKNGSKHHVLGANTYLMQQDSSFLGLALKILRRDQLQHELGWLKTPLIESLGCDVFAKWSAIASNSYMYQHSMENYHRMLFQPPKYDIPSPPTSPVLEMKALKPAAKSVAFHHHGKEVAVTLSGDNLWFCHEIKVGSHTETVTAEDVSQKLIQFNINFEDENYIPFHSDQIKVTLSSHFSNPVRERVPVVRKVYQFTFRQEQLAHLTPSELIETAYLSALLEQHQSSNQHQCFSSRFSVLRDFLEQVVTIVPVESLLYSIVSSEKKIALQCCDALQSCQLEIPPSVTMLRGLHEASMRLLFEASSGLDAKGLPAESDENACINAIAARKTIIPTAKDLKSARKEAQKSYREHISKTTKPVEKAHSVPTILEVVERQHFYLQHGILVNLDLINWWALQDISPQARYLAQMLLNAYFPSVDDKQLDAICGVNLQCVYPMTSSEGGSIHSLKSPLEILSEGRKRLSWLAQHAMNAEAESIANADESNTSLSSLYNAKMLQVVNDIRANELKTCTSLLGAFMEEQIRVPLMKSSIDTARVLNLVMSAAAVGVWALFSLSLGDIQALLSSIPSQSLLVEVRKYIRGIFKEETVNADETYAGKLQFMVQGLNETVSCNSHYISYSLERQLIELCKKLNISRSTPLDTLIEDWDSIFKDDVLSLVMPSYRSLIARWLKWALMVHHLREELAKYTSIGVIGLVNSGKSLLVSSLFSIQVPVGTTAIKRTTVPFLYNLNDSVEGLDVIDFPGVDDRDETIPDLAELLLALAQVVVFVVDYRRVQTESAKKWLELLQEKSIPILVCLTYADKLYAGYMHKDGTHPPAEQVEKEIKKELAFIKERLQLAPSCTVNYFSFCQDRDSVLNNSKGRRILGSVGVGSPHDVGDWLVEIFKNKLDQNELAERLHTFVHKNKEI